MEEGHAIPFHYKLPKYKNIYIINMELKIDNNYSKNYMFFILLHTVFIISFQTPSETDP